MFSAVFIDEIVYGLSDSAKAFFGNIGSIVFHIYMLHGFYHTFQGDIDFWDVFFHWLCHGHMAFFRKKQSENVWQQLLWVSLFAIQTCALFAMTTLSKSQYDEIGMTLFAPLVWSNLYIGEYYCWSKPGNKDIQFFCLICSGFTTVGAFVMNQFSTLPIYRRTDLLFLESVSLFAGKLYLDYLYD